MILKYRKTQKLFQVEGASGQHSFSEQEKVLEFPPLIYFDGCISEKNFFWGCVI